MNEKLTQTEIEALRQDLKQAVKEGEGYFKERAINYRLREDYKDSVKLPPSDDKKAWPTPTQNKARIKRDLLFLVTWWQSGRVYTALKSYRRYAHLIQIHTHNFERRLSCYAQRV